MSIRWGCHIYEHTCLFLLIFDDDVMFISADSSIIVYLHISEYCGFFIFCYCFWVVLVPFISCFDVEIVLYSPGLLSCGIGMPLDAVCLG